mmetsp:Transcript_918/g.2464  ORF Transcript_918/g.2464 Transcript_918/m.2464 type:complete len:372 (-) Transcript_918:454-1569(-)
MLKSDDPLLWWDTTELDDFGIPAVPDLQRPGLLVNDELWPDAGTRIFHGRRAVGANGGQDAADRAEGADAGPLRVLGLGTHAPLHPLQARSSGSDHGGALMSWLDSLMIEMAEAAECSAARAAHNAADAAPGPATAPGLDRTRTASSSSSSNGDWLRGLDLHPAAAQQPPHVDNQAAVARARLAAAQAAAGAAADRLAPAAGEAHWSVEGTGGTGRSPVLEGAWPRGMLLQNQGQMLHQPPTVRPADLSCAPVASGLPDHSLDTASSAGVPDAAGGPGFESCQGRSRHQLNQRSSCAGASAVAEQTEPCNAQSAGLFGVINGLQEGSSGGCSAHGSVLVGTIEPSAGVRKQPTVTARRSVMATLRRALSKG